MEQPPYKDTEGRWRTQSLFRETFPGNAEKYPPVFTLREHDYKGLPSFRRLFLEIGDPTGYKFAMSILGSYDHWKKLCASEWFQAELREWTSELQVKHASEAMEKIKEIAASDSGQSLQAAKWLIESGQQNKVGRPKKEKKVESIANKLLDDDFERMKT